MKCPKCGSNNDKVIESYERKTKNDWKRRRKCLVCDYRWNTIERYYSDEECKIIKKRG